MDDVNMEIGEDGRLSYNLEIIATDVRTGEVVAKRFVHNKIPDVGLLALMQLAAGISASPMSQFGVGQGTGTPSHSDVALFNEITSARSPITMINASTDNNGHGIIAISQYLSSSQANGYTITEAGVFGAVLYAHAVFAGIAKTSAIAINFTWTVTLTAS